MRASDFVLFVCLSVSSLEVSLVTVVSFSAAFSFFSVSFQSPFSFLKWAYLTLYLRLSLFLLLGNCETCFSFCRRFTSPAESLAVSRFYCFYSLLLVFACLSVKERVLLTRLLYFTLSESFDSFSVVEQSATLMPLAG